MYNRCGSKRQYRNTTENAEIIHLQIAYTRLRHSMKQSRTEKTKQQQQQKNTHTRLAHNFGHNSMHRCVLCTSKLMKGKKMERVERVLLYCLLACLLVRFARCMCEFLFCSILARLTFGKHIHSAGLRY